MSGTLRGEIWGLSFAVAHSASYACLKEKYLSTILVSKYVIVTYGQNKNFEDKTWCNHHCNGHTAHLLIIFLSANFPHQLISLKDTT